PAPTLPWRGRGLRLPWSQWVAVPALAAALMLCTLCALRPKLTLLAVLLVVVVVCVWARPALAAYLLIALTPLTAGINRGSALPVLRPQEAIALLAGTTLAARGVVRWRTGRLPKLRLHRLEWALVLMAGTRWLGRALLVALR